MTDVVARISAAAQYAAATIYDRRVKEAWLAKAVTTPQYQARPLLTPPPLTPPPQPQLLPTSSHSIVLHQQQAVAPSVFEAKAPATATLTSATALASVLGQNNKSILKRSPSAGSSIGKVREESGQLRQVSVDSARVAALAPISSRVSSEVLQDMETKKALEANRKKTAQYWSGLVSKMFKNMESTGSDSPPPDNASPAESADETLLQKSSKTEEEDDEEEPETETEKQQETAARSPNVKENVAKDGQTVAK